MGQIIYSQVIRYFLLHLGGLYGSYLLFTCAKFLTVVFALVVYQISLFGITAGVHRLWSHRAYKARLPLRIILAMCNSMAFQASIFEWSRDHRAHHKFMDTNGDPYNSRRGFFFSHIGWLMCKKHPDVRNIGAKVDCSDLLADPVVKFQKQYYIPSVLVFCYLLPTIIPWLLWSETLWNAYFVCGMFRHFFSLNSTFLVNSAAHKWGFKPYDIHISATETTIVSTLTLGEGFHNFHHTFPWDYSTSEWGWRYNLSTFMIDMFAKIGWAYDLKTATKQMIAQRIVRTGPQSTESVH